MIGVAQQSGESSLMRNMNLFNMSMTHRSEKKDLKGTATVGSFLHIFY